MSPIDAAIAKLPGSSVTKAAVAAFAICGALAYPVFRSKEGRQGHDYLSSERPEVISSGQDRLRKENRKKLNLTLDQHDGDQSSKQE